jgi:hypothetical protein
VIHFNAYGRLLSGELLFEGHVPMVAESPAIDADKVEREIIARLGAAKLRLRFDKVALRLVGRVKAALAEAIPEGETVVFTISAPIRLPAKTAMALDQLLRDERMDGERREIIHGNEARARRLKGVPKHMPKILGFVHSVESDASAILALAEARLLGSNKDA